MILIIVMVLVPPLIVQAGTLEKKIDSGGNINFYFRGEHDDEGFYLFSMQSSSLNPNKTFFGRKEQLYESSPDGKYISFVRSFDGGRMCYIFNIQDGRALEFIPYKHCSGLWSTDSKMIDYNGNNFNVAEDTTTPNRVVASFKEMRRIEGVYRYDYDTYMSAKSYMTSYPVDKNNYLDYNDIGYYFSTKMQRDQEALDIYKAVEKISPNRVVLMLNMADSYWAIDEKENALIYYKKYVDLMTKAGKEARIPAKVFERLEGVKL